MKSLEQYIIESKSIEVFHGNNYGTTKINPQHMNNSINEHGVGIYFTTDINTAKTYGRNIVKAYVNPSDFIKATAPISKLGQSSYIRLMKELYKMDSEGMWYHMTDYGVEAPNPEDIQDRDFVTVYNLSKGDQIRHNQQTLLNTTSVELFVRAWNKTIKYKGVYEDMQTGETFYVIIDPKVKLEKVS